MNKYKKLIFVQCVFLTAAMLMSACSKRQPPIIDNPDINNIYQSDEKYAVKDEILSMGKVDFRFGVSYPFYEACVELAKRFEEQYSNVKIYVSPFSIASTSENIDSRGWPDLFVAPKWHLPNETHLHQHMTDFYEIFDEDLYYDKNDWFMNVIEACAVDGRILEFPLNFDFHFIAINEKLNENALEDFFAREYIDWFWLRDAYDESHGVFDIEKRKVYPEFFYADGARYTAPSFVDYSAGIGATDDFQFAALLRRAFEEEKDGFENPFSFFNANPIDVAKQMNRYMFAKLSQNDFHIFMPTEDGYGHRFIHPLPYTDENGRILLANDNRTLKFCISGSSEKKMLVWEFIKFAASFDSLTDLPGRFTPARGNNTNMGIVFKPTYIIQFETHMRDRLYKYPSVVYKTDENDMHLYFADHLNEIEMFEMRNLFYPADPDDSFINRKRQYDNSEGSFSYSLYSVYTEMCELLKIDAVISGGMFMEIDY
ncbi:MAG: hypothetical protein FWE82_03425 [Defluviitaleaceae bacterium]|nr:hypothetical protein [Defluviitaleaceae bacterium]